MGIFSKSNIFINSGPYHLTSVDWKNQDHRRSVAPSLVNGVYLLEHDRQKNRQGRQAQAPPWWYFFHFQLIRQLIDDKDQTIFGAIYEYRSYAVHSDTPKYVVAFRGTLIKRGSMFRDVKLDLSCWIFTLLKSSRFQLAFRAVENLDARPESVWLAGHSLGSAIALLVGKNMTKMGKPMKTFLFNSPFISYPIEWIQNEKVKSAIRFVGSLVKSGIGAVKKLSAQQNESIPFNELSEWFPELFLNPADPICSGYIGYFQHRKKMEEIGASRIERLAAQQSVRCLTVVLLSWKNLEAWHLLPSANLTINLSQFPDVKQAHGIHQWWDPNFYGQSEKHQF